MNKKKTSEKITGERIFINDKNIHVSKVHNVGYTHL